MTRAMGWVAVAALLSGCGTVFGLAGDHDVKIHTRPPGATLYVNDIPHDAEVSPCKIGFSPGRNHVIEAKLRQRSGAEVKGKTTLTRELRMGVVVLNAIFTGGLGLIVDWMSGALYRFEKEHVVLNLGAIQYSRPSPKPRRPRRLTRRRTVPPPATDTAAKGGKPAAKPKPAAKEEHDQLPCEVCGEPYHVVLALCPHCGSK